MARQEILTCKILEGQMLRDHMEVFQLYVKLVRGKC